MILAFVVRPKVTPVDQPANDAGHVDLAVVLVAVASAVVALAVWHLIR